MVGERPYLVTFWHHEHRVVEKWPPFLRGLFALLWVA